MVKPKILVVISVVITTGLFAAFWVSNSSITGSAIAGGAHGAHEALAEAEPQEHEHLNATHAITEGVLEEHFHVQEEYAVTKSIFHDHKHVSGTIAASAPHQHHVHTDHEAPPPITGVSVV